MEILFAILPLVLVGVILLVVLFFSQHLEKSRTAALSDLAEELSLAFSKESDGLCESSLADFKLMQRGRGNTVSNVIRGQTQSVDLAVFDYRYVTGSGKNKTTHKHTVVAFDSPHLDLPQFELGPEGIFHKIASTFGYQDIDFDGCPTFNGKYLLRGADEAAIRRVFTIDVIQHFEAQLTERRKISQVEGLGTRLIVSLKPRVKPDQIRSFLEHAFGVYGVFKTPEVQSSQEAVLEENDSAEIPP